jgi:hypothetical protein
VRKLHVASALPPWAPERDREYERVTVLERFYQDEVRRLALLGLTPNRRLRKRIRRVARDRQYIENVKRHEAAIAAAQQPGWDAFGERAALAEIAWKFTPEAKALYERECRIDARWEEF